MRGKLKIYQYYIWIALISFVSVSVLPFLGSASLGWQVPHTWAGWVVYLTTKAICAVINVMIFACYMQQAKINVKDNKYYIEANEILRRYRIRPDPRGPEVWEAGEYKHKATTIAISSVLGAVGLAQSVLTFDLVQMLSYLFTVLMGVVLGVLQMQTAEEYWTGEYWQYAKMIESKYLAKEAKNNAGQGMAQSGAAGAPQSAGHPES